MKLGAPVLQCHQKSAPVTPEPPVKIVPPVTTCTWPKTRDLFIEIQKLFKSYEPVEGERPGEIRAVDIDVEEPLHVFSD